MLDLDTWRDRPRLSDPEHYGSDKTWRDRTSLDVCH